MKNFNRFGMFSFFLIAAYLLAACGGTLAQAAAPAKGPKVEANVVAFTGVVEAIQGTEWTISGHKLIVHPQVLLDPNIAVGDRVNVEARVSARDVVAIKVEASAEDDTVIDHLSEIISVAEPVETPPPNLSSVADASNSSSASVPQVGASESEVFGTVESITAEAITVDGVTYDLTNFTEIKDALTVGDTVKLHVTANADGMVTVREVEKSIASFDDHGSNSGGSGGSADDPNYDTSDDQSNDDSSKDGSNHDSNDDHGGDSGKRGSGS